MSKARISLSVDAGTVAAVDREAHATGTNRSRFVEGLLCAAVVDRGGTQRAARRLVAVARVEAGQGLLTAFNRRAGKHK